MVWQEEYPTETMESPEFGRFGPLPPYRAGSHRAEGFILASQPDQACDVPFSGGHVLDLAPTILNLMGVPIPEHLEGKPLPIHPKTPANVQ